MRLNSMLGKTLIECRVKTVLRPCRRSKDDHSVRVKQQTCILPVKQLKRPTKHMDDFKIWCRIFFWLAGLAVFRYLEKGWFEPNYSPDLRFFIFCIPAESSYAAACLNKVNKVDDQSHIRCITSFRMNLCLHPFLVLLGISSLPSAVLLGFWLKMLVVL